MVEVDMVAERGTRLVEALRQERDQGRTYPLTAARLRELVEPAMTDEELLAALTTKPTSKAIVLAAKNDPASPLALAEDAQALASGPLLVYALEKLASPEKPLHPVNKVVAQVDRALRPAFQTSLDTMLQGGALPAEVGTVEVKGKAQLYLKRFPPARPLAVELSERLLAALEARRQQGERLVPLAELTGEEKPALVKKAVAEEPFRSRGLLIPLTKTQTLAGLTDDREAILWDDRLLLALLEAVTTPKKPFTTVAELAAFLPEGLREGFCDSLGQRLANGTLPAGLVIHTEGGEHRLGLESNVPVAVRLGDKVLTALGRRRESGTGYPATLAEVVHSELPDTLPEQVETLVKDKGFKAKLVQAVAGRLDAPVALAGDEDRLAGSPRLVEFAVGLVSTAEQPLHPVNKIAGKLDKAVKPLFEPAVRRLIEEGNLPAGVTHHDVKGKLHLRLTRHPLPLPPAEKLANDLVAALQSARAAGPERYPTSLSALLDAAGRPADKVVKAALGMPAFTTQVLTAVPGRADSLVVLTGDGERLAGDPRLVTGVLQTLRTADNQAVPASDLGKKLAPEVRTAFQERLERQIESAALPAGVGCLRIKKKPYLFLIADLGQPAPPAVEPVTVPGTGSVSDRVSVPPPVPRSIDFAGMFDEAFERLDQERGSVNLVSLVRLRQEVAVERDEFDNQLQQLRRSGRYSLSSAEGRHGISAEERDAGIFEHGNLLLYVSRREE